MDIGGIFGKLKDEKIGIAIGFALTELQLARRRGTGFINNIQMQISDLIHQPHIPDLGHVMDELMNANATPFMPAVTAAVVGYFLEEIDVFPQAKQFGSLLKSLGTNVALGVAGTTLLDKASHSYSEGQPAGQPYGGHNGYPKGADYSPLGRRDGGYFTMPNVAPAGTPNLGAVLPASPKP